MFASMISSFNSNKFVLFYCQGGASTNNEMCLSYIYVYPKIPLMACVSTPTYDTIDSEGK